MRQISCLVFILIYASIAQAEENPSPFSVLLEAVDKNGDGVVSKSEFQGPDFAFGRLDLNGDGAIEESEFSLNPIRFKRQKPITSKNAPSKQTALGFLDKNRDGKISPEEFGVTGAAFNLIDANSDGFITEEEIRQAKIRNKRRQKNLTPNFASSKKSGLVDTHNHLLASIHKPAEGKIHDFEGAINRALNRMDTMEVARSILMPPPQILAQKKRYTADSMSPFISKHKKRFFMAAGGGTLNPLLHQVNSTGETTEEDKLLFRQRAKELARRGIVAFGEIAALHLSFHKDHPFMQAAPDHELMRILADVAAEYSLPIDLHMEAVPFDMQLPSRFSPKNNARKLRENISGLERLLQHNRKTKIVWSHLGWDSLGYRSNSLVSKLLEKHPNLYMSIRIPPNKDRQGRFGTRIRQNDGRVKTEWLNIFKRHPNRFVMGSDEFFLSPMTGRKKHPSSGSLKNSLSFLSRLPEGLKENFSYKNARAIYALP